MKNRLLCPFVLLLLCSGAVRGQEDYQYRPFETGAVWSVNNFKFGSFGDTVIGGREYVKLYRQESDQNFSFDLSQATYWGAFRNDTAGKKVYFAVPAGVHIYTMNPFSSYVTESDTELLFYDFSMALGDTVTCHFFEEEKQNVICTKVSRVSFGSIYAGYYQTPTHNQSVFLDFQDNDSIMPFGTDGSVKRMIVEDVSPSSSETILWIEGVGSSDGFVSLSAHYLASDECYTRLLCYCNNDNECLQTGFDITDNDSTDCFAHFIGGGVQNFERLTLLVYPSPACDIIRIESSEPESAAGTLTIWDVTGKQHYLSNTQLPQQLDVSSFPKGLYFIRFTSERENWSGKFIKL